MDRRYLVVACGIVFGTLVGAALYLSQPASWQTMNAWGVMTFACLGASLGCLTADPQSRI